jgi:hypothetical protein
MNMELKLLVPKSAQNFLSSSEPLAFQEEHFAMFKITRLLDSVHRSVFWKLKNTTFVEDSSF